MASQTVTLRPPYAMVGEGYAHTTKNSGDASGGVTLVPQIASKTGVIDSLVISFGAAITCKLSDTGGELLDVIYGAANSTWNLPEGAFLRSTGQNLDIDFTTSGAGNITVFALYHYE